jgi:succinate-semialdehyde dehydrogenase/glutarate-semialdehyde dehydrogenase
MSYSKSYSRSLILTKRYSTIDSSQKVLASFKNPDLIRTNGYINGKWVPGSEGATFSVRNPALAPNNGSEIAQVSGMSLDDFNSSIGHAHTSFQTFKKTTGRFRSEILSNLHKLLLDNKEDLAKLIVLENGKPYADALGEIKYSASFFQWFAEEAPRVYGDIIPSSYPGSRILTIKQPIGVCGILTPWNFPSAMIARKLAAATAAGCTTVIKPASETPLSALLMAHLAELAGFPPGSINVLPSENTAAAGSLVCEHPLVLKISFTGSTNVGKILMKQSSSTLKKLSFELGGNAPFIVFEDADIDKAVEGAISSKFRSSGQTCVCANRLYIHEKVYDEFAEKFTKKVKETTVLGNGLAEGVTHGPVIHERSMGKVRSHIKDALSKGAKVLLGGKQRTDIGENFHELTILGNVTSDMAITHEETFGPIAPLIKFSTEEEVIRAANNTEVGLAGYLFSKDISRVFRVSEELHLGMLGVNTGLISEAAMPFGGVGESGFGREGSKYGVDDYLTIKGVVIGGL